MARGKLFLTKLKDSLIERLKTLSMDDALKIASVVGLAYVIKPVLDANEETQVKLQALKIVTSRMPGYEMLKSIFPMATLMEYIAAATVDLPEQAREELKKTDMQTWVLSFIIAVLIVQFGPDIIKAFGGTMSGLALALLA